VPDQGGGGGEGDVAGVGVGEVEVVMVDDVAGAAAGIGVEIPTDEAAEVVGGAGGRMRAAHGDAAGGDEGVFTARELFIRLEYIEHARTVTLIQRGGAGVGPIEGFESAVQEERLDRADISGGIGGGAAVTAQGGLNQDGG